MLSLFQIHSATDSRIMIGLPNIPYRRNFNSFLSNPNYDFQFQFLIFLNPYTFQQLYVTQALQQHGEIEKIYFAQVLIQTIFIHLKN